MQILLQPEASNKFAGFVLQLQIVLCSNRQKSLLDRFLLIGYQSKKASYFNTWQTSFEQFLKRFPPETEVFFPKTIYNSNTFLSIKKWNKAVLFASIHIMTIFLITSSIIVIVNVIVLKKIMNTYVAENVRVIFT